MNQAASARTGHGLRLAAALHAILILTGCFSDRMASTEILDPPGKGVVTGIILDSDGKPATGAVVRAFPVDFNPILDSRRDSVLKLLDSTDGEGAFAIPGMDSGRYNLLAAHSHDGSRLMIRDVRIREGTQVASVDARLVPPGAMAISIPDTLRDRNSYVYIPGTPIYAMVDTLTGETHPTLLDSVPAGQAPGISYSAPDRGTPPVVLAAEIPVRSGDTVPVGAHPAWKYSRRLFLNTSGDAGAARIGGTIKDFPFLVRLDASNFRFKEAKGDGSDIRFARPDGSPLPYEIESWDSSASKAAIWVRLDEVLGGRADQFFRCYWGNPAAGASAPGTGVFAAGTGFRGVWHLQESGNGGTSVYKDATGNGNHGTGAGLTTASAAPTPMGRGQSFRKPETYIHAGTSPTLHSDTNLTLDAWVRISAYNEYANFVSRAFTANVRPTYEYGLSLGNEKNNFRFALYADTSYRDLFSTQTVILDKWYHVAGTYDGAKMRLYLDGIPADSLELTGALHAYDRPLLMGRYEHDPNYSLTGMMDEVRMSDVARSADYIRLTYESQREGSKILRFEAD